MYVDDEAIPQHAKPSQTQLQSSSKIVCKYRYYPLSGTCTLTKSIKQNNDIDADTVSIKAERVKKTKRGKTREYVLSKKNYKIKQAPHEIKRVKKGIEEKDILQLYPTESFSGTKFTKVSSDKGSYGHSSSTARTDIQKYMHTARELCLATMVEKEGISPQCALARFNDSWSNNFTLITLTSEVNLSLSNWESRLNRFFQRMQKHFPENAREYSDLITGVIEKGDKGRYHAHLVLFCPALSEDLKQLRKLLGKCWDSGFFSLGGKASKMVNSDYGSVERLISYFTTPSTDNKGNKVYPTARHVKCSARIKEASSAYLVTVELPVRNTANAICIDLFSKVSGCDYSQIEVTSLKGGNQCSFRAFTSKIDTYNPNLADKRFNNLRLGISVQKAVIIPDFSEKQGISKASDFDAWLYTEILNKTPLNSTRGTYAAIYSKKHEKHATSREDKYPSIKNHNNPYGEEPLDEEYALLRKKAHIEYRYSEDYLNTE